MNYKFITTLCLLCLSSLSFSQYDAAFEIYQTQPDQALQLLSTVIKQGNTEEQIKAHYLAGYIYSAQSSHIDALKSYFHALKISEKHSNQTYIRKAHAAIGSIHYSQSKDYHKAKHHFFQAYDQDNPAILSAYNLGLAYQRTRQSDSAVYYLTIAYEMAVRKKDMDFVYKTLNEVGLSYYYAGHYEEAIAKYHDLLDLARSTKNKKYIGYALNNIGNTLHDEIGRAHV